MAARNDFLVVGVIVHALYVVRSATLNLCMPDILYFICNIFLFLYSWGRCGYTSQGNWKIHLLSNRDFYRLYLTDIGNATYYFVAILGPRWHFYVCCVVSCYPWYGFLVAISINGHHVHTVVPKSLHTPWHFPIECHSKQVVQNILRLSSIPWFSIII